MSSSRALRVEILPVSIVPSAFQRRVSPTRDIRSSKGTSTSSGSPPATSELPRIRPLTWRSRPLVAIAASSARPRYSVTIGG